MDQSYKTLLKKQAYRFIGEHTAVKICGWTKKSMTDSGSCYKGKFYGIQSHRCIQMSPAVNFCDMDCVYCWRERNNSSFGEIDDPKSMMDKAQLEQSKLLQGFKGNPKVNMKKFWQSKYPAHVAISLNGEPTYYPHLNHLILNIKDRGWTSYLVTNGQRPDVLETLAPPTQLYISLDAPTKELHKEITKPMRKDSWERVLKSLDIMAKRRNETRGVIRLTIIRGLTDSSPEKHAELFKRGNPKFIEVKGYVYVGASQEKLEVKNMPYHEEVKAFANEIAKYCDYRVVDEHEASRVVLMMKDDEKEERFLKLHHLITEEMIEKAKSGEIDKELEQFADHSFIPIKSIKVKS